MNKFLHKHASGLLLALQEDLYIHRRDSMLLCPGIKGGQDQHHLAFIVNGSSRIDVAVCNSRFKRVAYPFSQWINGLDIIVAVKKNRRLIFINQPFTIDERVSISFY